MSHKITTGLLAVAASALFAGGAHAQLVPNLTPFSVEARGGLAFPLGDDEFSEAANRGTSFGANVTFHALPMFGVYGGYTRSQFGASDEVEAELGEGEFTISGFNGGIRFDVPTPLIPIDPFLKAGVVSYKLEAEFDGAEESFESRSRLGYEVGAGVGFSILPKVQLTPAVTYTNYSFETDSGEDETVKANHFRVDIGLRVRI